MNKGGAIELSFGMIFSIIIMIAIIGVAAYAITAFLQIGKTSQLGLFHQSFQETVDEIWASTLTNKIVSFPLTPSITHVCFGNLAGSTHNPTYRTQFNELKRYASGFEQENTNRFLYPPQKAKDFAYTQIEHIDVTKLGGFDCFIVRNGNVRIRLEKTEFDPLVSIQHE